MELLDSSVRGIPLYFIATKVGDDCSDPVTREEGEAVAHTYLGEFYEVNSQHNCGVNETFTAILKSLMNYRNRAMGR